MEKKETIKTFEKRMKTITVPEGFTASFGKDYWQHGQNDPYFQLTKPDDTEITFEYNGGRGHTRFKTDKGWLCFDRTGVEDSFYHRKLWDGDDEKNLDEIITEQLKRITDRREYYRTAVSIPTIPFTCAPERVSELKKDLAKKGHISFHPSGFGTGYNITSKPQRRLRYGETRAKPELEAFFGISPLYVSTMDCD